MSPSSLSSSQTHTARMTTQLHLSSQPKKVTRCFVLNDCSDDSETLANITGQNVPLPTESTGQTFPTPIPSAASTAVDTRTGSIFHVRAVDDDDEPWLSETDYKSGWNTRFTSGTYRGMLFGVALPDYPKQVVSLFKAESVPEKCVNFSLRHKNTTALTQQLLLYRAKQANRHLLFRVQADAKSFLSRGSKEHFVRSTCKIRGTVRKERRTPRLDSTSCSQRRTDHRGEQLTHEKDRPRRSRNSH